ncbi:hypothetical protein SALBM135S_09800 [Streptomyces alboniger]
MAGLSLAAFPLGQWIADARRLYVRGDMNEDRIEQLEKLGMVWSHFDVAWEEGLAAARGWAAEAGHLLAPLDATFQGYRVGIWLKNARAAARKAAEIEQRRAEGLPVQSAAGALSDERREQLEDIDPAWCPAWPVEWQRAFHLTRQHLEAGGALPMSPGECVHQGEDLGRWVRAQRLGFEKITGVQQWMLEQILGIEPASEDEKPPRAARRPTNGLSTSPLRSSSTSARDISRSRGSTSNGSSARTRRNGSTSSEHGSATSAAEPPHSPPSAWNSSPPSGCAGRSPLCHRRSGQTAWEE